MPRGARRMHRNNSRALALLPLEQQLLLELHYWEDMDANALAEIFDLSPSGLRTRLFRARQLLRTQMEKLAREPSSTYSDIDALEAWVRSLREHWRDS